MFPFEGHEVLDEFKTLVETKPVVTIKELIAFFKEAMNVCEASANLFGNIRQLLVCAEQNELKVSSIEFLEAAKKLYITFATKKKEDFYWFQSLLLLEAMDGKFGLQESEELFEYQLQLDLPFTTKVLTGWHRIGFEAEPALKGLIRFERTSIRKEEIELVLAYLDRASECGLFLSEYEQAEHRLRMSFKTRELRDYKSYCSLIA